MKDSTKFVIILTFSLFVCAQVFAKPAAMQDNPNTLTVADATPLTSHEMEQMRGGFIDPNGLIYNFAVNVATNINGALVFTRALTVSPTGASGQLQATANANLLPQNLPSGLSIGMLGNGNGVTVTNSNGQSATILNQTAGGAPSSIIINNASNANIAQEVNMTLTLKNVAQIAGLAHMTTQSAFAQHTTLRSLGF